jgi:hypothetical protein
MGCAAIVTAASGAPVGWGDPNEDGVRCYTADGDLLGKIHIPETVANLVLRRSAAEQTLYLRLVVAICGLHQCAGCDEAVSGLCRHCEGEATKQTNSSAHAERWGIASLRIAH